jgi:rod shape determining protein RodA
MFNKLFLYLKNLDWILFSVIILLICFGLAEIYSVALGQGDESLLNFKKQILFAVIGIIIFFVFAFVDYHYLRSFSNYFYLVGIILLAAVLFFGSVIRGTKGWFFIFGAGIQPVEFIKFILILFLARYFSGSSLRTNQLKHLITAGSGFLIFFLMVLAQPDLGSGLILFAVWLIMVILAGFDKKYFFTIAMIIIVLFGGAWSFYLKPYQKQRIMTFVNPSFDPLDQGYNVAQAIIAVGAGRVFGRGIGFGSQSQLKFLPESQNDFIFAVVSEELGFLGIFLILSFFIIFFYRCIYNVRKVIKDDFGIFFVLGSVALIFVEMFINIGMNIGILPVVGISLPFLSYGGSSLISTLMLVGTVESIIIRSKLNY